MKSLLSPLLAVILLTLLVFTVQAAGEFAETVLLGDLDGDEDPDLLVSDPGDGTAGEDAGAIYVFLDPPTGNLTASDADIRITGAAGSQFGTGMALADMDGDDDLDIVIGAPNASNGTGAVYVFLQPFANGTYLDADVTLSAPAGFLGFGATIAGTEVSGDNRTDLAIASIHRPEGTGLVGEYFDDPALTSRNFTRLDAGVGFDWGLGGPPGLDPDSFSVRWSGLLLCNESGDHTFIVDADDGMRLWVDGRLLVDRWEGGPVHASATVFLPEGYHDLRAEYHDATFRAYAYVNWSTPYSSGPIPAYNLVPSMASPVSIVEGTWNLSSLNVSRILIEDGRGVALGSALLNTSNGLFIGSWSLGRVHRYDETTEGTVVHYTAVPHTKGSGDETGEDIDDLRRDDGDYYEVERDSDADDLVIDTFDVSSIDPLALEHGTIVSVVLKVGYYTDQYYAQWGSRNYVQYAKEGETYADSDIRPYLTTTEVEETFDLYGHGVTTIDDIEDLDIHFNNADGGWVKDSVFFDYIVIDIGIEAPYLSETVRGPPSFGMALASDDQALYVGAPCAGPSSA